jgi:hypothetical protein
VSRVQATSLAYIRDGPRHAKHAVDAARREREFRGACASSLRQCESSLQDSFHSRGVRSAVSLPARDNCRWRAACTRSAAVKALAKRNVTIDLPLPTS